MIRYIQEILSGLWSLLVGMKLTARHAFSPTITAHYPFQTLELSPAFRGHTDLVIDPETVAPFTGDVMTTDGAVVSVNLRTGDG